MHWYKKISVSITFKNIDTNLIFMYQNYDLFSVGIIDLKHFH